MQNKIQTCFKPKLNKAARPVSVVWMEIHVTGSDTPAIYVIAESHLQNAFKLFCNQILFPVCLQIT